MMDKISIEDLIAQRLEHIVHSFENLSKLSVSLPSLIGESNAEGKVQLTFSEFLKLLVESYTTETEKVVLSSYFPFAPDLSKVG